MTKEKSRVLMLLKADSFLAHLHLFVKPRKICRSQIYFYFIKAIKRAITNLLHLCTNCPVQLMRSGCKLLGTSTVHLASPLRISLPAFCWCLRSQRYMCCYPPVRLLCLIAMLDVELMVTKCMLMLQCMGCQKLFLSPCRTVSSWLSGSFGVFEDSVGRISLGSCCL